MPKLSALQWLIVAALQIFYGFAVFALTRDHYQRQAPPQAAAPTTRHATPAARAAAEAVLGGRPAPSPEAVQDPAVLAQIGDEHFARKEYDQAIQIYRQVLQLAPHDVDTLNDLGLALYYSGNTEQALDSLKQGVEKAPSFQRIWLTLGFVQMNSAEREEAKFALQEAVKLGADNPAGQEAKRMLGKLSGE